MGRIYSATFQAVAVTAAQDLISLLTTANVPIKIWSASFGQSSDSGDAQDELLRISIKRGMTTVGSGGSVPALVPINPGDVASVTVARANDTTAASAGTIVTIEEQCFNVRAGYIYMPMPELRPICDVSKRIAFNLVGAPADSLTMSGVVYFEELN